MKIKVLYWTYCDHSWTPQMIRAYMEKDFEQAQKDYEDITAIKDSVKDLFLVDVEVFGMKSDNHLR